MKRIYVALRMSKKTSAAFGGKYKIQYRVHFQVAYYVLWCRGIVKAAWYCSSFSSPQLALISAKKTSKSRKENKSGFMRTPRLWTFELQLIAVLVDCQSSNCFENLGQCFWLIVIHQIVRKISVTNFRLGRTCSCICN